MWKNFFFFSQSQRIAIIVLLSLIVVSMLLNTAIGRFSGSDKFATDSLFLSEVESFKASLIAVDSLKKKQYYQQFSTAGSNSKRYSKAWSERVINYTTFNPNTLDSIGFINLGLKPYVVSNILKYRRKGGTFKSAEAFANVYGLSEDTYRQLQSYIDIPEEKLVQNSPDSVAEEKILHAADNVPAVIVELNTADTTQLMQIKGIGRGYAHAIIRFRKQSGGFVQLEQLKEIHGMTIENYQRIAPHCTVNPEHVQQIRVNTASVEKLRAHPYLNFYQARQIYELRRKKGKLSALNDISTLSELNDSLLLKIEPYLSFE